MRSFPHRGAHRTDPKPQPSAEDHDPGAPRKPQKGRRRAGSSPDTARRPIVRGGRVAPYPAHLFAADGHRPAAAKATRFPAPWSPLLAWRESQDGHQAGGGAGGKPEGESKGLRRDDRPDSRPTSRRVHRLYHSRQPLGSAKARSVTGLSNPRRPRASSPDRPASKTSSTADPTGTTSATPSRAPTSAAPPPAHRLYQPSAHPARSKTAWARPSSGPKRRLVSGKKPPRWASMGARTKQRKRTAPSAANGSVAAPAAQGPTDAAKQGVMPCRPAGMVSATAQASLDASHSSSTSRLSSTSGLSSNASDPPVRAQLPVIAAPRPTPVPRQQRPKRVQETPSAERAATTKAMRKRRLKRKPQLAQRAVATAPTGDSSATTHGARAATSSTAIPHWPHRQHRPHRPHRQHKPPVDGVVPRRWRQWLQQLVDADLAYDAGTPATACLQPVLGAQTACSQARSYRDYQAIMLEDPRHALERAEDRDDANYERLQVADQAVEKAATRMDRIAKIYRCEVHRDQAVVENEPPPLRVAREDFQRRLATRRDARERLRESEERVARRGLAFDVAKKGYLSADAVAQAHGAALREQEQRLQAILKELPEGSWPRPGAQWQRWAKERTAAITKLLDLCVDGESKGSLLLSSVIVAAGTVLTALDLLPNEARRSPAWVVMTTSVTALQEDAIRRLVQKWGRPAVAALTKAGLLKGDGALNLLAMGVTRPNREPQQRPVLTALQALHERWVSQAAHALRHTGALPEKKRRNAATAAQASESGLDATRNTI